jgi:hypothetical protein
MQLQPLHYRGAQTYNPTIQKINQNRCRLSSHHIIRVSSDQIEWRSSSALFKVYMYIYMCAKPHSIISHRGRQAGLGSYINASTRTPPHQPLHIGLEATSYIWPILTAVSCGFHLPVQTNDRIMSSNRPQAGPNRFL